MWGSPWRSPDYNYICLIWYDGRFWRGAPCKSPPTHALLFGGFTTGLSLYTLAAQPATTRFLLGARWPQQNTFPDWWQGIFTIRSCKDDSLSHSSNRMLSTVSIAAERPRKLFFHFMAITPIHRFSPLQTSLTALRPQTSTI